MNKSRDGRLNAHSGVDQGLTIGEARSAIIVQWRLYQPNGLNKRRSTQHALYHGLLNLLKLFAPFLPHIAEEIQDAARAKRLTFDGSKGPYRIQLSDGLALSLDFAAP